LFLVLGFASDCVALVMPSVAAMAWQGKRRGAALAGWAVWFATMAFALSASVGFAALNISDTMTARITRNADRDGRLALNDAMASRDRECGHGVGPFCRSREAAVADRRQALDAATAGVAEMADPQVAAAVKLVSGVSAGAVKPTRDDLGMVRLLLLCLLPQLAGLVLMIARST
jgi:hypothetical protein